jgi:hypothetical protein
MSFRQKVRRFYDGVFWGELFTMCFLLQNSVMAFSKSSLSSGSRKRRTTDTADCLLVPDALAPGGLSPESPTSRRPRIEPSALPLAGIPQAPESGFGIESFPGSVAPSGAFSGHRTHPRVVLHRLWRMRRRVCTTTKWRKPQVPRQRF